MSEVAKIGINSKKEKLKSLFMKFADISNETGVSILKARQFMKLLQESGIVVGKGMKSKLEVLFAAAGGKKGMQFDTFFSLLIKLADLKYPETFAKNKGQAVELIVESHFLPLYDRLTTETKKTDESSYGSLVYEQDVKIMLNSIFPVLKDIYDAYFGDPFKKARNVQQVEQIASKQILVFIREFDLLKNYYLSKQLAISMLNSLVTLSEEQLTNNPEDLNVFFSLSDSEGKPLSQHYGVYFTLNRFFIFLFWTAIMGFETTKIESLDYSYAEKIYFLLAKMELSKGFADLTKKYFLHYATPHTLIPHSSVVQKLVVNNPLNIKQGCSLSCSKSIVHSLY